jgi:hypothetical protein
VPPAQILISGIVHDDAGNPVPLARVYFVAGPGQLPDIAALTDQQGRFTLSVGSAGTYEIEVSADAFHAVRVTVTVVAGTKAELDIRMSQ